MTNSDRTGLIQAILLFVGVALVFGLALLLANRLRQSGDQRVALPPTTSAPIVSSTISTDTNVSESACPAGVNVQFEQGATTSWLSGTDITAQGLIAPVSSFHINCFTNNGTATLTGGTIALVGPGGFSANVSSPEGRNITLPSAGTYTASCRIGGTVCDQESFTIQAAVIATSTVSTISSISSVSSSVEATTTGAVLPVTAVISDDADRVIVSFLVIGFGYWLWRARFNRTYPQ